MTAPAQTLELIEVSIAEIARPNHSLIVADSKFMATLKQVEATVATLKITDTQSSQQAADLLSRLTSAGTALEKSRVQIKAPYLNLMRAVDDAAKAPQARIDAAKRTLSSAQVVYSAEQRRLAEEAEKARQAELRRLEAIRLAEEKAAKEKADKIAQELRLKQEADAKAAEEARLAGLPVPEPVIEEVWEEEAPEPIVKTATELAIEAVRFAPVAAPVKAQGVREVTTLVPFITDVNLLPDCFVEKSAKIAAIRSTFCSGFRKGDKLPELRGCRFDVQTTTQSTGKAQF